MFFGRIEELETLKKLRSKKLASLVCMTGRRRIGKSSLIEEFGKGFQSFIEIQGLGPSDHSSNQDQLDHFANQLSLRFHSREEHFQNWTEAFMALASLTKSGEHLILLDEISWMGKKDPLFSSRLKEAWDIHFKKNPKLILVLCGSVSSWIEENISKNANFEGRVSVEINLQELSLSEIHTFWKAQKLKMSSLEKMLILSITGGVPKYLEEILPSESASQNLIRLCYQPTGFLFNEYDKIFTEIFDRKGKTFEKIIRNCLEKKLSPIQLAHQLQRGADSELSEYIHTLQLSGFLQRDFYYLPNGKQSKLSHLRVKDNYLRFYLKHIAPLKDKILSGGKKVKSLAELKQFETTLGFQFENVLLANRPRIHSLLGLSSQEIHSSSPYLQKKKVKNKGACQIDLLIHTFLDVFFLCEFKCQKIIDRRIVAEIQRKMAVLTLPKRSALKPVLIYLGEVAPNDLETLKEFFYRIIPFDEFLL